MLYLYGMQANGDIFQYHDFRAFLRDAYADRKTKEPKFSHRFINGKIGVKSAGWFADVVGNRMGLNPRHIRPLATLFRLKSEEREYFRLLVELDQADSVGGKTEALKGILSFKGAKPESIGADRFAFYETWYHSALRELLLLGSFGGDYAALARMLEPPILPKQVKKSLLMMARLGLVSQSPEGHFKPKTANLVKDPSSSLVEWVLIQKAFIQLSLGALDRSGRGERDYSALTLSFSPEGLRKAGEEIAGLRKRLLAVSLEDKARDRVYQCNFQVFPLTRSIEAAHGKS